MSNKDFIVELEVVKSEFKQSEKIDSKNQKNKTTAAGFLGTLNITNFLPSGNKSEKYDVKFFQYP